MKTRHFLNLTASTLVFAGCTGGFKSVNSANLSSQSSNGASNTPPPPPAPGSKVCTDPGFEPIHRLNEKEYKNTLRDLFGTQIQYSMSLPIEYGAGGFYNNAKVLDLAEDRLDRHFVIADAVINQAFQNNAAGIMICNPATVGETACATQIFKAVADKAFRRPVSSNDPDILKYVSLVTAAKGRGDSFETGIRIGLQAILVSPRFLFRSYAKTPSNTPRYLDGYELASRLSYFLWSSMPDAALFQAANQLTNPDVLRTQTLRMLADPKSDGFVDNFMSQWISLHMLDEADPDTSFYPGFTATIKSDMKEEVREMLKYMIKQDLSFKELLTARYSFLNARLASHYGIAGVTGTQFRKVDFGAASDRSGLIGLGGILTMTSNPNRTSVVRRGFWVMSNFLCNEPPQPPANIPPVAESGSTPKTLRERMAAHTASPACIGCHSQMDQYGFALENYGGVGQFRTLDAGLPIDNQALLPTGESFTGLGGLQEYLTKSPRLDECLSKRLLTYAVGRQMASLDQCNVSNAAAKNGIKLSELKWSEVLLHIINNDVFLKIRGE